ncbi:MAG: tyrosine-type recombinase/integrase, partial [Steroidobacteraceae bacterium]
MARIIPVRRRPATIGLRRLTVREAWETYAATRSTPPEARDRSVWRRFIEPAFANRPIAELTTGELERWLAAQLSSHGVRRPARVPLAGDRDRRRRAQDTANRRFNLLRAILNSAYRKEPDRVPNADAWRRVRAFQRVDRPRTRVLTAVQCRCVIGCLPPALGALALAALYTGCRLGELQALRVADIGMDRVRIEHSKSGRARCIPLSGEGAAFFAERIMARPPETSVFEPLSRIYISRGMRAACAAAAITPPATFHDLRRSYGSLLLISDVVRPARRTTAGAHRPPASMSRRRDARRR